MKAIGILLALGLSMSAAADKYVCRELSGKKVTAVLTLTDKNAINGQIKEGEIYDYLLEVYRGDVVSAEKTIKGTVETEDVMFNFSANDKSASMTIYMDEMDQASLELKGEKSIRLVCY